MFALCSIAMDLPAALPPIINADVNAAISTEATAVGSPIAARYSAIVAPAEQPSTYAVISPSRLHALSRSEWGLSPQAWLAERRISHVRKWLAESDLPIADLALRAGYADQSALTRAMQRLTGLTPAAYRRQTRLEQKNRSPEQDSRTRP